METVEKKNGNRGIFLLQALLFSALGIVMIIFPGDILNIVRYVIAIALFLVGLSAIWAYLKDDKEAAKKDWYILAGGIFLIVLGICLLALPNLLPILLGIAVGVWILARSIQLIAAAITFKSFKSFDWLWFILVGLMIALVAIFIIRWPGTMTTFAVILIGIGSLLIGIYYFLLFSKTNSSKTLTE